MPDDFDRNLQETLDNLPPRKKRRRLGAVKTALIAAAACVLLTGTALAVSPTLREMLSAELRAFAPVAQEQDSEVYTWNGFEIKALSAMADGSTLRAYVQVRDVEKRGRLDVDPADDDAWDAHPVFVVGGIKAGKDKENSGNCHMTFGEICSYDATTQTAVVLSEIVGKLAEDLSEAKVHVDTWDGWWNNDGPTWEPPVIIPLNVEIMPSRTVLENVELCGLPVEEVRISAMGMTVQFEKVRDYMEDGQMDLTCARIRVKMKDGAMVSTKDNFTEGDGYYRDLKTGKRHGIMVWHFADPMDPDQVEGLYVGEDYFPAT